MFRLNALILSISGLSSYYYFTETYLKVFKGGHWVLSPLGRSNFGALDVQGALIRGGALGAEGAPLEFWSLTKQNLRWRPMSWSVTSS